MPTKRRRTGPYAEAGRKAYAAGRKRRALARSRPGTIPRIGYGSVARARGAAVTGEMKYFDCELSSTAISACTTTWVAGTMIDPGTTINLGDAAVATPLCLFVPKVSAALNGRIGRKCRVLKISFHGILTVAAQVGQADADPASLIRLMLVMDTQTNAAQMTGANLMNDAGAATVTTLSHQNPNFFGRFRVLKEKMITISALPITGVVAGATIVQTSFARTIKFAHKFAIPILVNFNATNAGTVADIIDNSFHIVCGCSNVAYAPSISYYTRVAYKE